MNTMVNVARAKRAHFVLWVSLPGFVLYLQHHVSNEVDEKISSDSFHLVRALVGTHSFLEHPFSHGCFTPAPPIFLLKMLLIHLMIRTHLPYC